MPVAPTYPGVYIEEIPSGVRTITGVPTSIAAFLGRAARGPVDEVRTVNGFADFERAYGGLDIDSAMSFAVRDFFLNGGGQAVVGRLFHADEGEDAAPALASLTVDNLELNAASAGAWGNTLRARVSHAASAEVAAQLGLAAADLFSITLRDTRTGEQEQYLNVSVKPSARRIDQVLVQRSALVRIGSETLPEAVPSASADPAAGEDPWADNTPDTNYKVADADRASDGQRLTAGDYIGSGLQAAKKGLYVLERADLFNLLCLPPEGATADYPSGLVAAAATYCEARRAMLLLDAPSGWTSKTLAKQGMNSGVGASSKNAAIFFPRLRQPNPLREQQVEEFVPCGAVAGVMARTDTKRGVWKAPAGIEATLRGVPELSVGLTDEENGELNPLGLNCLRAFPVIGRVVWGARTLKGADLLASEWKYLSVRRFALFIEESLYRGTKWVVFEPNDEPLWAQVRLNIGAFMHNLFRQGAFKGSTPREAYFVKCDKETTTQNDIDLGIVNIVVGFAPLKPAEFVIIKIQQIAGEIEV